MKIKNKLIFYRQFLLILKLHCAPPPKEENSLYFLPLQRGLGEVVSCMQFVTKNALFLLFFFFFISPIFAQDMERAKKTVSDLCAPAMRGRGYIAEGDKIAAKYIAQRLEKARAKKFGSSYFQEFSLDVNTFPNKIALEIDGQALKVGTDFIVSPVSTSGSGKGEIYWLDSLVFAQDRKAIAQLLATNLSDKILVLNAKDYPKLADLPTAIVRKIYETQAFISLETKLTMSVANAQLTKPTFSVLKNKFPSQPQKAKFSLDAKLIENYKTQNIIGYIEGKTQADSFLVFSAHYDHLGGLGKESYFAGANDNASGVSLLLELLEYYKANPANYSVVFMFFGAEEAGLIGSKFYVENPLFPLLKIKFLINLDLVGTGVEGITVVNATIFPQEFALIENISKSGNYFPTVKKRGKAANSDHYFFTEKGVKSVFIYAMGGIQAYHDVDDKAETLPLSHYEAFFKLLTAFAKQIK